MPEKRLAGRHLPAIWTAAVFLLWLAGAFTAPALAHGVVIYAYASGDTIYTESTLVPDTPVRQGKILVQDRKTGKLLLTGQTDDRGKFSFKIPAAAVAEKMDLAIVVDAALGHRGEWLLKAGSYLAGLAPGKAAPPAATAPTAATAAAPGAQTAGADRQMLSEMINKTLERQLAPIQEKLTALTVRRTSLPDIIGGIGYILGIFGLWAYFQSRGKKTP